MEKKLNKMEEINEEVKVEELTEETLDEVDGGANKTLIHGGMLTEFAGVVCIMSGNLPLGFALLGGGAVLGFGGLVD